MSNRLVIDAFALAREHELRAGNVSLACLTRLMADLPEQSEKEAGLVVWSVQGETDAVGHGFLRLHVQTPLTLVCQRCLAPFEYPVASEVVLQLVGKESELDSVAVTDEDEIDPGAPEKVLGSHRFDLLAQVEDELLLCVPYVPKHEYCPDAPSLHASTRQDESTENVSARPSPFAVLARLKQD
jgi:uncharacterized protein